MDLKFVSYGLWSEKQNILLQHMRVKEFWILTNKCGNNLKHENEDGGHGHSASFSCFRFPHLLVKIQNSFYACVKEGCSASLIIAPEKQI